MSERMFMTMYPWDIMIVVNCALSIFHIAMTGRPPRNLFTRWYFGNGGWYVMGCTTVALLSLSAFNWITYK